MKLMFARAVCCASIGGAAFADAVPPSQWDRVAPEQWGRAPVAAEIAAAYPARALAAGVEGRSSISCTADRVGALEDCKVLSESPAGAGFGAAELKLADIFRLVPRVSNGQLVPIGRVTIPMNWTIAAAQGPAAEAWNQVQLAQGAEVGITWRRLPHGEDLDGTYPASAYAARLPGWAVVSCRTNGKGQLRQCALVEENPPGNGFGEAALRFAPIYFLLDSKASDGSSVDGLKVTVKLNWSMSGLEYFYSRTAERPPGP